MTMRRDDEALVPEHPAPPGGRSPSGLLTDAAASSSHGPSPKLIFAAFGGLTATLSAGYGVMFTIVDDYESEYGISESSIGLVIGIGFLAAFISQVFIAPYADRGHARNVVIVGVLVSVAGLLLMALGTSLTPILIGRIVNGIGVGASSPAIRRIVILADPEHLGTNLGRLLSADVFGFALGPAVSAVLVGPLGIPAPFIAVSAVAVLLMALVALVPVNETAVESRPTSRLAVDLLAHRPFLGAAVLSGVVFIMIGGFDSLWALVHAELRSSELIATLGITLFAIPLVLLGPWGGRLAQTFGPFRLAAIGLVLGAGFMFGYGLLPTGTLIFALAMGHALSDGVTSSASGVAAGMVVPDDRQAGAQGIIGAAQALSAGTTAVVTGHVYENFGREAAYSVIAGAMIVFTVVGLYIGRDAWSMRRRP
jgi:MFS family permease